MEQSGTILSIGETPLALGMALKVSIDPTVKKIDSDGLSRALKRRES